MGTILIQEIMSLMGKRTYRAHALALRQAPLRGYSHKQEGCAVSVRSAISELTREIADHFQARASALQQELLQIESRKREIEAELAAANLTHDRLLRFQETIGGKLQCPSCWVCDEIRSSLTLIPGTGGEDFLQCDICHLEFSIPA
jgi:hypothetical protein